MSRTKLYLVIDRSNRVLAGFDRLREAKRYCARHFDNARCIEAQQGDVKQYRLYFVPRTLTFKYGA